VNVYMNEDGEAWVPVAEATVEQARPIAMDAVGAERSVVYLGIETVPVHEDEHYHWDAERCPALGCREAVECHHFEWDDEGDLAALDTTKEADRA